VHTTLIHTGQHYDHDLSEVFLKELGIPRPDRFLNVGSGSHARQTAKVLEAIEDVLVDAHNSKPCYDRVVVVGDVNSTMAAALASVKLAIPVAHVEAGLRSFDWSMPEEINRIVTDAVSDLLFVSEPSGAGNLKREGRADEQIHLVGNVMIDTLLASLPEARRRPVLRHLKLSPRQYGVVTLHRPANVDDQRVLTRLVRTLSRLARQLPLVFPVHPRTKRRLAEFQLIDSLERQTGLIAIGPLGYLDFLAITSQSLLVVTDSGGLQEECTAAGHTLLDTTGEYRACDYRRAGHEQSRGD